MVKQMNTTSPAFRANAERRRSTWSMTRYDDLNKMKADEYRYWQSQPGHARIAAISELTTEMYAIKGQHVPRLQRTLVRLKQA
jgi:hypothetical protein